MTTAAERLLHLAGKTGTAAALLLAIGSGATAGASLVDYSGLESVTATEHLLAERAVAPAQTFGNRGKADEDDRLYREHYEYLDGLREIQIQIADDLRGARTIIIPASMPLPSELSARAMRGNLQYDGKQPTAMDILDDPVALAMLAVLIDEASE